MNPITWVTEKIVASVATLIGGMVISKVETETLKSQARTLNELEEQAREYEANGNPLIAELLRDNAANLAKGIPGESTARIEAIFRPQSSGEKDLPRATKKLDPPASGKKRRGRPPKKTESNDEALQSESDSADGATK